MSKRKLKAKTETSPEPTRRLKFNGKNGYPWMREIPARDLEHHELIELSLAHEMLLDDFIEMLCSNTPGRQAEAGIPLYSPNKPHLCPECGEEFTAWDEFHNHALTHVSQEE